jgi:hypothetical protein
MDQIWTARYVNIVYCQNCDNPHVVLFNEENEPLAQAVLSVPTCQAFVKILGEFLLGTIGEANATGN